MADQSVLRSLEEAGDQLTKARRIDHWFYFSAEDEMIQCKNELIKAKFNVEHTNINKESSLPFELIVWRVDHVDIDTIYPITSNLRIFGSKVWG